MMAENVDSSFVIGDLDTLKVISDPLRGQILEALVFEPMTVKQVAEKLGVAPTKLYYHIRVMEKHGLIKVVETRVVSGIIEKQYRATAPRLKVEPSLLTSNSDTGKENINTVLLSTIETTREDILRSLQARYFELEEDTRCMLISRQLSRFSDKFADEFCQRLDALLKEFSNANTDSADMQTYALTIAFYPSFYFHEPTSKENANE
jgi:DNA-binding transcriptional ArsR family regulator